MLSIGTSPYIRSARLRLHLAKLELALFPRRRVAGEDVRGVVVDHQPLAAGAPLEDVGGEYGGHRDVAPRLRQDVLGAGDPAESALDVGVDIPDAEAHLVTVLEDGLPRTAHRLPPREHAPARVHAPDVNAVSPHLLHQREVQALEDAVEPRVGLLDLGPLVVRRHLGPLTTSSSPRR